jgi:pSer/pThr/pTyr-binding forkhead associated (FHA) protein
MKAELIPENGDAPIPVARDISVVGRREFCDIRIDHATISKRHCILVKTAGLLILRDLATTNGTKVKGQRVRWAALLPGDKVTIGGYKVQVFLGPDDAPSPSELRAKNPVINSGFAAPTPQSSQLARQRLHESSTTKRTRPEAIELNESDLIDEEDLNDAGWNKMKFPSEADPNSQQFFLDLD